MRIVHLSDIHIPSFGPESSQQKVITALAEDLRSVAEHKWVDLIVFSGDVALKGGTNTDFIEHAREKFFKVISAAVGMSVPIILCPGNHDVNLAARKSIFDPVFKAVDSPTQANLTFEQISQLSTTGLFSHMDGYITLAKAVSPSAYANNPFYYTEKIEKNGVKIGIASLNSAWLTRGGGTGDYGHLFISERQVDLALAEITDCTIKIAVMHHTLKWLSPSENNLIHRLLATNFHAVLCGHNHENNADGVVSNVGSFFISNTGCIYETREYFNGYSVIDLDLNRQCWVVHAREYFYQRNMFSVSSRFSENGVCEYALKNDTGSSVIVIPSTVIAEIQDRASSKLLSYTASDIAPKQVGAMFVEPPMAEVDEQMFQDGEGGQGTYLSLLDLAKMPESLIIVGKRESGKTLLLHEIAANRFLEFDPETRLGLVADLAVLSRLAEAALIQQLVEGTGAELRRRDILDLLENGRILICVDNVNVHKEEHLSFIKTFCQKFPKVRYILGSPEEVHSPVSVANPVFDIGVPVRNVFIHSFRRRQVREMVKRWFGEDGSAANVKFTLVNQLLSQLNVPATPFLVSVLLWVIEQRPHASPVNQAAAIEVLIDGLLEKLKESKSRVNFDSTIQVHFLSDLAVHMDSLGKEWLSSLDFEEFVISYFKRKGLQVSTAGFAEELQRKGLLYSASEQVMFKFDCFRAYFLAKRFSEHPALWQKALTAEQVHRYANEIDLFTGLHRDRRDILERSVVLCRELHMRANIRVTLDEIESFTVVPQVINEKRLALLESDVLDSDYDSSHREARLDELERPSSASLDHSNSRKRDQFEKSSDELLFVAGLRILSIVVRNSELIDDVALKQEALSLALDCWAKFIIVGLDGAINLDVEEAQKEGLVDAGSSPEKIRQQLITLMPQAVISMMADTLSTPKLQVFLESEATSSKSIIACLAALLALDSNSPNAAKMVKDVLNRFGKNKHIVQIVFFKLLIVYYWNQLTPPQVVSVRECLSDAFGLLRDGPPQQKAMAKSMFLANLDKKKSSNELIKAGE